MTAADIEAGRQFWQLATLQDSPRNTKTLRAHCIDCHAIDGRDLQYFGFSNHSIIVRSQFHGLTEKQGTQIAAYVRSHPIQPHALPCAPVYQPGSGTSDKPIEAWAAGAGLESVVDDPKAVLSLLVSDPHLVKSPSGIFDSSAMLRVIDVPMMQ